MTENRENGECFVISPIGGSDTQTRLRADRVLRHIIRPVTEELGFNAIRSDEMQRPGMIPTQIMSKILEAPLAIADLTEGNPNVFYELSLRHTLQKPVVHIIEANTRIPFDIAQFRTIHYDLANPDSVVSCRTQLSQQIREAMENPASINNPISDASIILQHQLSMNPLEQTNSRLLSGVERLHEIVWALDDRLNYTGARGRLLDEIHLSLERLTELIETRFTNIVDSEDREAITTALDIHKTTLRKLLRDMGVDFHDRVSLSEL